MMIPVLSDSALDFPSVTSALQEPNGLLAVGGDLSPERLVVAYQQGIFPWFSDNDPILWWSPDPRAVFFPDKLHISRSLAKFAKKQPFQFSINQAFEEVISGCIEQRAEQEGTWITDDMYEAYCQLHDEGHAHSIEVWQEHRLVGGLYGIIHGSIFCGESMFHRATNASKLALITLVKHLKPAGLKLIDCQMPNPHLLSLGAQTLPRKEFLDYLNCLGRTKMNADYLKPQSISGNKA